MRCAAIIVICLALTSATGGFQPPAPAPQTPAPTPGQPPPVQPQSPPPARRQTAAPPRGVPLTVMVTALDGKTLPDVLVRASGPVDREAETDPSGLVTLANMMPGTYRLRFEHQAYITFEKEVSLAAGKPLRASAALSAAPPPPSAPPKPEPPPPAPLTPAPDGTYKPSSVAILDFLEKNFIGGAPARRSPLGCTGSTTSTLVQTREPLDEHVHGDADEVIYVLAGEAMHRIEGREQQIGSNTFLVIPRGVPHSLVRRGRNPLTLITILAGQPCQGQGQGQGK